MITLSSKIREQLISSFGAELSEHVQTMTDGLLALEQKQIAGAARQETLEDIFRAAHSLKGAARALGVTAVEQLAHALENLLDLMQQDAIAFTPDLFTVCYRALDTIQLVQAIYDSGGSTPPIQVLQTLTELAEFRTNVLAETAPPSSAATSPHPITPKTPRVLAEATAVLDSISSANAKAVSAVGLGSGANRGNAPTATMNEAVIPKSSPLHVAVEPTVRASSKWASRGPGPLAHKSGAAPTADVTVNATVAMPECNTPGGAETPPGADDETVRVSVTKLDALMAQLSELLITKIRGEQRLAQVEQTRDFMNAWQKEWHSVRKSYNHLVRKSRAWQENAVNLKQDVGHLLDYVSSNQEQLHHVYALINAMARDYANDTKHTALIIDTLEREVKQVRMLPLSTITGSFRRMVRDLAQNAGKKAILQIVGGEVELDKRVLEQIKDPLIHLLRNAIDHGLESPKVRESFGKPRGGTVTLSAEYLGKEVVIRIKDDGRGLDIASIRKTALRKDEIGAAAETMAEAELIELIFNPRFSTSPIITDVSGRGVGLDVVRRNVAALRGRIDVEWRPQQGTTFSLILPMTLTSTRGLLMRAGGQQFAIAFSAIERILRIKPEAVTSLGGHETIQHQGRPYPLVRLSDVLELTPAVLTEAATRMADEHAEDDGYLLVVIVATAERRMAFVVDDLEGEQELVIKGMGHQLRHVGGIAGAAVMGDGTPLLVLNVTDLIKLVLRGEHRIGHAPVMTSSDEADSKGPLQQILVVDDSVTTRTLEKNVLEAAGYTVQLAVNGQEALNLISAGDLPDLIISDVVMPRLDGFGLTLQVKNDARTADVPVILVTSLDSNEDKARGIEVGADAYIIKRHFDQNRLLETIEQLI